MQSLIKLVVVVAAASLVVKEIEASSTAKPETLVEGADAATSTLQTFLVGNESITQTPQTTDALTSTTESLVALNDSTTLTPQTGNVPTTSPQNVTEMSSGLPAFEGGVLREAGEEVDDEDTPWFVPGCRYYCMWKEDPYCCDDGSNPLPPDHEIHEGLACPPMGDQICKSDAIYLATYSIKTARYSGSLPLVKGAPKEQLMCASDGYCLEDEKCCPSQCAGRHICLPGLLPIEKFPLDSDEQEEEEEEEEDVEGRMMEEDDDVMPEGDEMEKVMEDDEQNGMEERNETGADEISTPY
ncbi:uncharacterized protein [Procambarus clarkii]|uniref:uncharacterized protein isoform X2 n=1 Tax=Procambarus clarkii TaxID=6728 RepID=UPI001E674AE4|nr:uncharacterized protein LOC123774787 isoform X2 [Procambarus clarkii]